MESQPTTKAPFLSRLSPAKTLRLILGDQLNEEHSWYRERDDSVLYVVAELHQEASYVKHHVQKICGFFLAMQKFAQLLREKGHRVLYLTLDDTQSFENLPSLLSAICRQSQCQHFAYQRPDEYRLSEQLASLDLGSEVTSEVWDSEHFLLPYAEIKQQFKANKPVRMEAFYRRMRKRFNILVANNEPMGGQWNFDAQNRQTLKSTDLQQIPAPLVFGNNVSEILERLDRHQIPTLGHAENQLIWPVTNDQASQLLDYFCRNCLPNFGKFQDAMTEASPSQWSLYHSRLSFCLNNKLLHPRAVIDAALSAYQSRPDDISLPQVEGFVRQILGWREYIRGIYWVNMPGYAEKNALKADTPLPDWYWSGKTKMNCLKKAIGQSLEFAYAHHIQRLMVTGNFALLAGLSVDQVDNWYLGIYIDAIEWVEMPNTRGMALFADGGIIASKPYAASGNYINKMSDYCKACFYSVKQKTGAKACPFNSLYWHFLNRHKEQFSKNPRMVFPYKTWEKMQPEDQQAILQHADHLMAKLESL